MENLSYVHLDENSRITATDGPSAPYLTISADRYTPVVHLFFGASTGADQLVTAGRQLDQLDAAIAHARRLLASHTPTIGGPDDEPTDDPDDEPVAGAAELHHIAPSTHAGIAADTVGAHGHDLEPVRSILARVAPALPFTRNGASTGDQLVTESEARALAGDR